MTERSVRDGFTLFEVILALAIVGGAMAVISQVVWSGMENARMTQDLVRAELLAENLMAELLAGIRPMESSEDSPFEEEDGLEDPEAWVYSVDVAPLESEEMMAVSITVRANTDQPRAVEYTLLRWVLVPIIEEEETEELEDLGSL